MKKNLYIWGIDIFRGIAALLVFFFHYYTFFLSGVPVDFFGISLFKAGHLGVDIFFVLSGFLVTLSLFVSKNFSEYAEKRIRRIVPLAFVVLLGVFLLKKGFSGYDFLDLGIHLLFLQGFFSDFYHSMNPVMWTLSVEMLFYFLLPFLWLVLAKKNIQKFLVITSFLVFLSFLWRGYLFFLFEEWGEASDKIFLSEQLWGRFDQFFLGIVLAVIVKKKIDIFLLFSRVFSLQFFQKFLIPFFLISGGVIFSVSYYLFAVLGSGFRDFFLGQVFLHACIGLGFFLFLIWFLQVQKSIPLYVRTICRPLIFTGKISYGIYLFHFPILSLVHALFERLVGGGYFSFILTPSYSSSFLFFFSFLISFIITLCFSYLSYEFFEKRFLKKY